MRSTSRANIPHTVQAIISDFSELVDTVSGLHDQFKSMVNECVTDMQTVIDSLPPEAFEVSDPLKSTDMSRSSSARNLRSHSSSYSKLSVMGTRSTSRSYLGNKEEGRSQTYIDSHRIKQWTHPMGMILYSCDLPVSHQTLLTDILEAISQQEDCNAAIDRVVDHEATTYSLVFQAKRQQSSQAIRRYLESCISDSSHLVTSIIEFYRHLAIERESHHTQVQALRKLTQDELASCLENSQHQLFELEAEYNAACKYVFRKE